jgi:hypothetical protein
MQQVPYENKTIKRKISWCFPEDVQFWRILVWWFSAIIFFICALILISGWCMEDKLLMQHKRSQLEFISTQMGACLENDVLVTYGFVLAMAIQMLILLDSLLRCMHSAACPNTDMPIPIFVSYVVSRQGLAIICGLLVINFVINMAGVAEFRSEGGDREKLFHYISAVLSISLFGAVHFLICLYLRRFTYAADYKYIYIRNVYLILTLLFFFLWLLQIFFVIFFELAKIVEWLILLIGLVLQIYAEFSLYAHTPRCVHRALLRNNIPIDTCTVCSYVLSSFLFVFVINYISTALVRSYR